MDKVRLLDIMTLITNMTRNVQPYKPDQVHSCFEMITDLAEEARQEILETRRI